MPNATATAIDKNNSKKVSSTDHTSKYNGTIGNLPETERQLAVDSSNTNVTDGDTDLSASSQSDQV